VHDVQSRHRSKLFTVEARKRLPDPDSHTSAAMRIGCLRRGAFARTQTYSLTNVGGLTPI